MRRRALSDADRRLLLDLIVICGRAGADRPGQRRPVRVAKQVPAILPPSLISHAPSADFDDEKRQISAIKRKVGRTRSIRFYGLRS